MFVQSSFALENEWDTSEWQKEKTLRHLFFYRKEEVCFHDIDMKEGENLLDLLRTKILVEVNLARQADNLSEVVIESGPALSFLSLPESWTNLKYSDAVNLDISKPHFKKRVIVIKSQNPCK